MATLFNTKISETYEGLIKTSDNGVIGAVEKNLTDGLGNASTLSIGTSTASFTGTLDLTNATVLGLSTGAVDSVNGLTGVVVLTTTNIAEGTNLYFTDARVAANSAVTLNTAKVGITTSQANAIVLNTAKVGITTTQANEIAANTLKVGITTQQATDITANNAKISFDSASSTKLNGIEAGAQVNTITSVNSLTGAVSLGLLGLDDVVSDGSNGQVLTTNGSGSFTFTTVSAGGAVDSVNGATGVVVLDTDDIAEGTTNKYMVLGTTASTALAGNTSLLQLGTTSTTALAGDTTTITPTQAANITTNNSKVSMVLGTTAGTALEGNTTTITTQQATDITNNNNKVGITTAQANEIAANTLKTGITSQQATDITNNNAKISFTSTGGDNYLSKWDSNTLVDSLAYSDTNGIGIGTTTPSAKLEVKGDGDAIILINDTDNPQLIFQESDTTKGKIYTNGQALGELLFDIGTTNRMRLNSNGLSILGDNTDQGLLKLYCESSSHYVGIQGPNHTGGSSYTLQLPNALPNVANQILESNNTGTTSWIDTPINTIDSIVSGEPTGSDQVINVVSLTQAEYDAGTPIATTFYIIT